MEIEMLQGRRVPVLQYAGSGADWQEGRTANFNYFNKSIGCGVGED